MAILEPVVLKPEEEYRDRLWVCSEVYRFYVEERRKNCNYMEIMDLWLIFPMCNECAISQSYPFGPKGPPDITPGNWLEDVQRELGINILTEIFSMLRDGEEYSFSCKHCSNDIKPWGGDDAYIGAYHLEEHYGIPLETPRRVNPSKKLRQMIFDLYGHRCFGCGKIMEYPIIDHILPRAYGGDSSFRNLQPLCEKCGKAKDDMMPKEVQVYSYMYFTNPPSDAWEGLFW